MYTIPVRKNQRETLRLMFDKREYFYTPYTPLKPRCIVGVNESLTGRTYVCKHTHLQLHYTSFTGKREIYMRSYLCILPK